MIGKWTVKNLWDESAGADGEGRKDGADPTYRRGSDQKIFLAAQEREGGVLNAEAPHAAYDPDKPMKPFDALKAALEDEQAAFNRALDGGRSVFLRHRGRICRVIGVLPDMRYQIKAEVGPFRGERKLVLIQGGNDWVWSSLLKQAGLIRHPLLEGSQRGGR